MVIWRILLWFLVLSATSALYSETSFDEGRNPNIVKLLRATLLSDRKSVFLSWEPPKEEGELIIARSNSVIDTPDKLYVADSLGKFKTGGSNSVKTYYDYNLKPGTYYFAVILAKDIRRREVKLFGNQNYTTIPVTIEEGEGNSNSSLSGFSNLNNPPSPESGNHVTNLAAHIERKNIRLDWTAPPGAVNRKTIYTIYRSNEPLTSLPLMQKAVKLAEVSHPTVTYLDQGLERSQTLYYGVSVKEWNGNESLPLVEQGTSLRVFYVRDNSQNTAELIQDTMKPQTSGTGPKVSQASQIPDAPGTMHVRAIGYERIGKGAVISWTPPEKADETTAYTIYASIRPLNEGISSFNSGNTVKVTTVLHPKTNFYIKELKEMESLYFGVTARSASIPEDYNLQDKISYIRFLFDKDQLLPGSEPQTEVAKTEEVKTEKPVKAESIRPAEIIPSLELEEPTDTSDTEFSVPREEDTKVSQISRDDILEKILKDTYRIQKYELALDRLESFSKEEKDPKLLGKTYFYLGMSHLKRKELKAALRYFLKKETKSYQPERTQFWTNQTLEALGKLKS